MLSCRGWLWCPPGEEPASLPWHVVLTVGVDGAAAAAAAGELRLRVGLGIAMMRLLDGALPSLP